MATNSVEFGLIARRPAHSWLRVALMSILPLGFLLVAVSEGELHWPQIAVSVAIVVAILVLSEITLHWPLRKNSVRGARWSAWTQLLDGRRISPGRLFFTPESVVWIPSRYSAWRGRRQIEIQIVAADQITMQSGPAIFDVSVYVQPNDAGVVRFVTLRTQRLQRAIRGFAGKPPTHPKAA